MQKCVDRVDLETCCRLTFILENWLRHSRERLLQCLLQGPYNLQSQYKHSLLAAQVGSGHGFCSVGNLHVTNEHLRSVAQEILSNEAVCSELRFPKLESWERKQIYNAAIRLDLQIQRAHGRADGTRVKFAREGPQRTVSYSELAPRWEEPLDRWLDLVDWGGMGGTLFYVSPVHRFSVVVVTQVMGQPKVSWDRRYGMTLRKVVERRLYEARLPQKEESDLYPPTEP